MLGLSVHVRLADNGSRLLPCDDRHTEVMYMEDYTVIDIDFYRWGYLPRGLDDERVEQNVANKIGILAVRTLMREGPDPIKYEFIHIGTNPGAIKDFLIRSAKEDGVDLNELAKNWDMVKRR